MCGRILIVPAQHVLPAVVDTSFAYSEAAESGLSPDTRHVHGALSRRFLPREETVYHLQPRLPHSCLPGVL